MSDPLALASILIVSPPVLAKELSALLLSEGLSPAHWVSGISEAKRSLVDTDVDLIILDSHRALRESVQFAIDLARSKSFSSGVILLVDPAAYEKNLYQAERMGIVTFKKPLDAHLLLQTIRLVLMFQSKIRKLESRADKLQKKMEGDHLVNRAKLLLMDRMKLSEEDAHYFIEKKAMDTCVKKTAIAADIVRKYTKS